MTSRPEEHYNAPITTQAPATIPITGDISTETDPNASLTITTAALAQAKIGPPLTMEKCFNLIVRVYYLS